MEDLRRVSIGSTVRTLRETLALSRQELSERSADDPRARVTVEMIAKVEQGKRAPSGMTLRKLALALGLQPEELSTQATIWETGAASGFSDTQLRANATRMLISRGGGKSAALGLAGALLAGPGGAVAGVAFAALTSASVRKHDDEAIRHALRIRLDELLATGTPEQLHEIAETLGIDTGPTAE